MASGRIMRRLSAAIAILVLMGAFCHSAIAQTPTVMTPSQLVQMINQYIPSGITHGVSAAQIRAPMLNLAVSNTGASVGQPNTWFAPQTFSAPLLSADPGALGLPLIDMISITKGNSTVPGYNFTWNADYGSFGDTNTTFGFVVNGGKNVSTANTTGSWTEFTPRYTGYGGDATAYFTAAQILVQPTASSFNNSGNFTGSNPECLIPTGMTPVSCVGEEIDQQSLSNISGIRQALRIADIGSTGSHATSDSAIDILSTGIGWTNGLYFGDPTLGQFPVVAGGNIISAASTTVALLSGVNFQAISGNPTLAMIALPPSSRGICFGLGNCNGGVIAAIGDVNGLQLLFDNDSVHFNSGSNVWTVDNLGDVTMAGTLNASGLPSSAGSGGLYACVDSSGNFYKKSSCP